MAVQLRRYQFPAGSLELMLPWWHANIPALRERFGFRIEFAYALHESCEFVWAVSFPGTIDEFERAERGYFDSPERAVVEAQVPGEPPTFDVRFVDEVIV